MILRGAAEACATAGDLRVVLAELRGAGEMLRSEASGLRLESARLRDRARAARAEGKTGLTLADGRAGPEPQASQGTGQHS